MPRLVCDGRELELRPGESVLDALGSAGVAISSSCRVGACQSCLVQALRGSVPPQAQRGLRDSLREQGYFLACQATPSDDLEISLKGVAAMEGPARVSSVEWLAADVLRVRLEPQQPFAYRAGQFVTVRREDGLARAYSLASLPGEALLELHVRVLPGGAMSNWLASSAALGCSVAVRGPSGECCYVPGSPAQPLVLVGAGTGLAPLWGVLRDALANEHQGRIELWHGTRTPDALYLREELSRLSAAHANLSYFPCALAGTAGASRVALGALDELLLQATPSFADCRLYLCGDAALVQKLKRKVFLAGASLQNIHSDPFIASAAPTPS